VNDANSVRSSIVISVTTLLATILGGAFALAVTWIVGAGAETDGFLAAYSAYTAFTIFGTSMRVALLPQLGTNVDADHFVARSREVVGRLLPLAALACAVFVVLAPLIGYLLTLDSSARTREVAIQSIALLSLAAFFQIWAAITAAVLGGARRFVASSIFAAISLAVSVAIGVVLLKAIGILGAGIGMVFGAAVFGIGQVLYLRRLGFFAHPAFRAIAERETWLIGGRMAIAAVLPVLIQLYLTLALAALSGTEGAVTAYTYGYLTVTVISAIAVGPVAMVSMPAAVDAVHQFGRDAAVPFISDVGSMGFFLFWPLALCFVLFGYPVVEAVFGPSFQPADLAILWDSARIFMALGIVWALGMPYTTYALAQHLYRRVAIFAAVLFAIHAITMALLAGESAVTIAAAHVLGGTLLFTVLAVAILREQAARAALGELRATLPAVALGGLIVGVYFVFGAPSSVVQAFALSALACALYGGASYLVTPTLGRRLIDQLLGRGAKPEPAP
jgi:O-antigen/teichoic acid export membrane protein